MSFGKRLAQLRRSRNITQNDLAERIDLGISQIRRYEADGSQPTLDVIRRLVKVLGVSADELIFEPGEGAAPSRIADSDLLQRFEKISSLPDPERQAALLVLDGLIVKSRIQEIASETPPGQPASVKSGKSNPKTGHASRKAA